MKILSIFTKLVSILILLPAIVFAGGHAVRLQANDAATLSQASTALRQKVGMAGGRMLYASGTLAYKNSGKGFSEYLVFALPDDRNEAAALAKISGNPALRYVEALRSYKPLYIPNDPQADSATGGQAQALKNMQVYQGWDYTQGDTTVKIGILDSGNDIAHPDLAANLAKNYNDPINGDDDDRNGYVDDYYGYDLADNDNDVRNPADIHGSVIAGITSATFNNGIGIAGLAARCGYVPVKVFTSDSGFFMGYPGILYASQRGCQVINLSWGSNSGNPSQFEQDVINYAVQERGAVVIAAAGNTPGQVKFYPAAYDNVIAVGFTRFPNDKSYYSSYGPWVDLVAPAESTFGITTSGYGAAGGGSSFSAPMVAGLAALVKVKWPTAPPAEVEARMLAGADKVDTLPANIGFRGRMGIGRINFRRTLSGADSIFPQVQRVIASDEALPVGQILGLRFELLNRLGALYPGSTLSIGSRDTSLHFITNSIPLPSLAAGERYIQSPGTAFSIKFSSGGSVEIPIEVTIFSGGKSWQQTLFLNRYTFMVDAITPALRLTLGYNGRLGYVDALTQTGSSFQYQGRRLMGEGGLILATSPTHLVSNITEVTSKANELLPRATARLTGTTATNIVNSWQADFSDSTILTNTPERAVGVNVSLRTYGFDNASQAGFLLTEYKLQARKPQLDSLRFGLFTDWDLNDLTSNFAAYDSTFQLGYAWSAQGPASPTYAGIALLTPGLQPFYFPINASADTAGGNPNLSNGLPKDLKWRLVNSGLRRGRVGGATGGNILSTFGAKLPPIPTTGDTRVAFAWVAGNSLEELITNTRKAKSAYYDLRNGADFIGPDSLAYCSNTTVTLHLPAGNWTIGDTALHAALVFTDSVQIPRGPDRTLFISNPDSIFPGPLHPLLLSHVNLRTGFTLTFRPGGLIIFRDTTYDPRDQSSFTVRGIASTIVSIADSGIIHIDTASGVLIVCQTKNRLGCTITSCDSMSVFYIHNKALVEVNHIVQPNPFTNTILISNAGGFRIVDALGRICYQAEAIKAPNVQISTDAWPSGVYTITWADGRFARIAKL